MSNFRKQIVNYLLVNEWSQEVDDTWYNNRLREYGCSMYDALECQIAYEEEAEVNDYPE